MVRLFYLRSVGGGFSPFTDQANPAAKDGNPNRSLSAVNQLLDGWKTSSSPKPSSRLSPTASQSSAALLFAMRSSEAEHYRRELKKASHAWNDQRARAAVAAGQDHVMNVEDRQSPPP